MKIKVDIQNNSYDDYYRYFFTLIKILSDNSKEVWVNKTPKWFNTNLNKNFNFLKYILNLKNVFFFDKEFKAEHVISDRGDSKIIICNGIFKNNKYIGLTIHPTLYNNNSYLSINFLRKNTKNIGVLFAGLSRLEVYYVSENIFNRYTLINLAKQYTNFIKITNLDDLKNDLLNNLIILEKQNIRIPNIKWLDHISRSKFFLCMPGAKCEDFYVFCKNKINYITHHIVEAMSVGTIPIIYKNDLFFNNFKHDYNCLFYSSPKEMITMIDYALSMPEEKYNFIRKNMLNYYDNNLTTSKLFDRIIN